MPAAIRVPWATRFLASLCVLAGLWQLVSGINNVIWNFGARPVCYLEPWSCGYDAFRAPGAWLAPLLLSLFLHGGFWHLTFNVWFLWVFGPQVEETMGRLKFVLFYFAGGLVATGAYFLFHPLSRTPVIGASGAIAAVLGAALVLRPRGYVLSYVPPFWVLPIPASIFLGFWFFEQIVGAVGLGGSSDTAWLAHIGGFAFGAWWVGRKGSK